MFFRKIFLVVVSIFCLVIQNLAYGENLQLDKTLHDISIPELDAAEAINQLAVQTGSVLLFPYDLAKSQQANPVVGQYTLMDALDLLLKGSDLVSDFTNNGVIKIAMNNGESDRQQERKTMNNSSKKSTLFAAASAALLSAISPGGAVAQNAGSSAIALEEIIVTAQRRAEDLQSSPVSVAAFSEDRLRDLNVTDPNALSEFVPGLSIGPSTSRGGDTATIAIRGISETSFSPVLDPAVGIYIDDVYYGRPQISFLKLIDVERVEVLRGPQGTLFGKNSTGGAIRYITRRPDFDGSSGNVSVNVGNYDTLDISAAVNVALSDTLAVRVKAATLGRDEGFVHRLADGDSLGKEDTQFGSIQVRWKPSEKLDVNFSADVTRRDTDNGGTKLIDYFGFGQNPVTDLTFVGAGPGMVRPGPIGSGPVVFLTAAPAAWNDLYAGTALEYNPDIPNDLYTVDGSGALTRNKSDSLGVSLNISYEISDNLTLKSITGYRDAETFALVDQDDQANAFTAFDDVTEQGVDFFSQELQLSGLSFDDRLNWVAGLYYSTEEPYSIELADTEAVAGGALQLNDSGFQETDSYGVYLQGTYDLTEKLALTLGGRYTSEDKSFTVSQVAEWDAALAAQALQLTGVVLFPPPFGPTAVPNGCDPVATGSCVSQPGVSGGDTFTAFTPRVAIEYQWNDDFMTYASFSEGFKSGGTNDRVADIDVSFQEEELLSYEVGVRSEFFDNRARLNVTYFNMDHNDKQLTISPSTNNPICQNRCTANGGDATITGWEIESLFAATENLRLHANVSILDAEWDTIDPGAGIQVTSDLARAPELSYNVGASYNLPLSSGASLTALLDYSYTDEQESAPQDSVTLTLPDYGLVNARLKYISPDESWELSVFCSNCADEEYIVGGASWAGSTDNAPFDFKPATHPAFSNPLAPSLVVLPGVGFVNVGAPRMVGANFRYNF